MSPIFKNIIIVVALNLFVLNTKQVDGYFSNNRKFKTNTKSDNSTIDIVESDNSSLSTAEGSGWYLAEPENSTIYSVESDNSSLSTAEGSGWYLAEPENSTSTSIATTLISTSFSNQSTPIQNVTEILTPGYQAFITNFTSSASSVLTQYLSTTYININLSSKPSESLLSIIANETLNYMNVIANLNNYPSFSIGQLYTATQLNQLGLLDTIGILAASNSTIDANSALVLGAKFSANASILQAAKVLSGAPIQIILNSSPTAILENLNNIDITNMNSARKGTLANTILSQPTAGNLETVLQSRNYDLIEYIPLSLFLSVTISSVKKRSVIEKNKIVSSSGIDVTKYSADQLPNAVLQNYARDKLKVSSLKSVISDTLNLPKVVPVLRTSDLSTLNDTDKFISVVRILAAETPSKPLSNIQKVALHSTLIQGAARIKGVTASTLNANTILQAFDSSTYAATAKLFIEGSTDYLNALLADSQSFGYVLGNLSLLNSDECIEYSLRKRANFSEYAVKYLLAKNNRSVLISSDLKSLGKCFASTISLDQFKSINAGDFLSAASLFQGIHFQPDNSSWINEISNKINILATTIDMNTLFSSLGELMIFYSKVNQTDPSLFKTYGSAINNLIKCTKNLNNNTVVSARLGASDNAALKASYSNWQNAFVSYLLSTGSKNIDTSSPTCDQLTNGPPSAFTVSQLSKISSGVFSSCLSILGAASNAYSSDQLSTLAGRAVSYGYASSSTSEANIQLLNQILTGYTPAQLTNLSFTQDNTISILGSASAWSNNQLSAIMSVLLKNGINITAKISILGNLACGLSKSQISSIKTWKENLAVLKTINNVACPALSYLYSAVKTANSIISLDSENMADFNGLIGGAPVSDLNSINPEVFSAITNTAIMNFPADTINHLSPNIFNYVTNSQLTAFLSSPNYANYSDAVKSTFASLTGVAYTPDGSSNSADSTNLIKINLKRAILRLIFTFCFIKSYNLK